MAGRGITPTLSRRSSWAVAVRLVRSTLEMVPEEFFGTMGIHNYNVWDNVVTDRTPGDTGLKIHTEYWP